MRVISTLRPSNRVKAVREAFSLGLCLQALSDLGFKAAREALELELLGERGQDEPGWR